MYVFNHREISRSRHTSGVMGKSNKKIAILEYGVHCKVDPYTHNVLRPIGLTILS